MSDNEKMRKLNENELKRSWGGRYIKPIISIINNKIIGYNVYDETGQFIKRIGKIKKGQKTKI